VSLELAEARLLSWTRLAGASKYIIRYKVSLTLEYKSRKKDYFKPSENF